MSVRKWKPYHNKDTKRRWLAYFSNMKTGLRGCKMAHQMVNITGEKNY